MTVSYDEAEQRAQSLLPSVLTREERAHFEMTGEIIITGSRGTKFTIQRHTVTGNVIPHTPVYVSGMSRVRGGVKICAHPRMSVWSVTGKRAVLPLTDALIAQILAIKADEAKFCQTAYFYSY